jgi:CHAT domain-containing protein
MFPAASVFTGSQATKGNFLEQWDESTVIHVAAHGDLDPSKGPALLLAPAIEGRLGLSDITGLPVEHKRPYVALSACQTALDAEDRNPSGSEISSVAYAFSRAGASGVVATLWVVDDEATAQLMSSVYTQMKETKKPGYPMLRQAQLELLESDGIHKQPFYWAPFIHYGLPQ